MTPYQQRLNKYILRMAQDIPFGKRPKKLPVVLSDEEVTRLIQCVDNPKHRMVLLTCYATGMRLREATNLKVKDVDGDRKQIFHRRQYSTKDLHESSSCQAVCLSS